VARQQPLEVSFIKMAKKGITTIIAILLAIVLTLSLASSTFFFVSKTQKSTQEQGTRSSSEYLVKLASCIKIMSVKYQVNKLLEVTVKNCGNRDIDLEKEKINVLVESGSSSCIVTINSSNCPNCTGTIPPGNMRPIVINTTKAICENTNSNLTAFLESNLGKTTSLSMSAKYAYASTTFVPEYIVICEPNIIPRYRIGPFGSGTNHSLLVVNNGNFPDNYTLFGECMDHTENITIYYNSSLDSNFNCVVGGNVITYPCSSPSFIIDEFELNPQENKSYCLQICASDPGPFGAYFTLFSKCKSFPLQAKFQSIFL